MIKKKAEKHVEQDVDLTADDLKILQTSSRQSIRTRLEEFPSDPQEQLYGSNPVPYSVHGITHVQMYTAVTMISHIHGHSCNVQKWHSVT